MCVRVRPCVHKGPWCSKHKYQLSPWLASLLMPLRPPLQQIPQTPSSQPSQRMSTYCMWRRPQWAARILCPMTATCSSHCSPTQPTVPTQPHLTSLRQVEHCILFLNCLKCRCNMKCNRKMSPHTGSTGSIQSQTEEPTLHLAVPTDLFRPISPHSLSDSECIPRIPPPRRAHTLSRTLRRQVSSGSVFSVLSLLPLKCVLLTEFVSINTCWCTLVLLIAHSISVPKPSELPRYIVFLMYSTATYTNVQKFGLSKFYLFIYLHLFEQK